MKRRSPESTTPASGAFDALETGRLTWVGLTLAALGWLLLIGETTLADIITHKILRQLPPTFHSDVLDIAKCIIGSGFGLAIIGALQTGFGALNRFFEAVLMRSAQRTGPIEQPGQPAHVEPEMNMSRSGNPYRILPDGSVEVEMIVGTRTFATLAEAKEFI